MNTTAIQALIRNDIRLYFTDRRAVIVGVLVPILIAAFFGYIFGGTGQSEDTGKIPIAVVDEDQSSVSRAITADLASDALLQVSTLDRAAALEQVKSGKKNAAAVFPQGFGEQTTKSLFTGTNKPQVELLVDPSQATGGRVIEGLLAQYSMQEISKEAFTGTYGRKAIDSYLEQLDKLEQTPLRADLRALLNAARKVNDQIDSGAEYGSTTGVSASSSERRNFRLSIPYTVASTPVTARDNTPYNSYAHSFAGMAVQFVLFGGIDAGVVLLLTRQRGIWQRLRSAPLSRSEFMLARALATTLIGLFQITVIYLAALLVFMVRIEGSWLGFIAVGISFCLLNATFGLMLATLGRSASTTRGLAMMTTLLLVMIGGAWVPAFLFPRWLQNASRYLPTRWAVDGLDGATWRGLPFDATVLPTLLLIGSAAACLLVAIWRFRWEE
jgi:ABC-type multidrug transport system permease subunit